MTVGQLIDYLSRFEKTTPVVLKDSGLNAAPNDYVDLDSDKIGILLGKPLFKSDMWGGHQLYDGAKFSDPDSLKILSLNGIPKIQAD